MSRLRIWTATTVVVVWVFIIIYATVFDPDAIGTAQLVTPIMLAVSAWLYAEEWARRSKDEPK